jgi:hypothetical protein
VKRTIVHELALFAGLLSFGFLLLPLAIYAVGGIVFGSYADGYGAFFGALTARLFGGVASAWFLVLSPYLLIQTVRLGVFVLRRDAGAGH